MMKRTMRNIPAGQAHQQESDVHPGDDRQKKRGSPHGTFPKSALPALRWVIQ